MKKLTFELSVTFDKDLTNEQITEVTDNIAHAIGYHYNEEGLAPEDSIIMTKYIVLTETLSKREIAIL